MPIALFRSKLLEDKGLSTIELMKSVFNRGIFLCMVVAGRIDSARPVSFQSSKRMAWYLVHPVVHFLVMLMSIKS